MVDNKGKTVSMTEFMAVKNKVDKLESENRRLTRDNTKLTKRLEVLDLNDINDEDLKNVKEMLLDREGELDAREKGLDEREDKVTASESAHKEREKADTVRALAAKYGVSEDDIKDSDDPEKEAMKIVLEGGNKGEGKGEGNKPPAENPAENVFDGGGRNKGVVKKQIVDMSDEEFEAKETAMKAEYVKAQAK